MRRFGGKSSQSCSELRHFHKVESTYVDSVPLKDFLGRHSLLGRAFRDLSKGNSHAIDAHFGNQIKNHC